jgi:hypothetical protein
MQLMDVCVPDAQPRFPTTALLPTAERKTLAPPSQKRAGARFVRNHCVCVPGRKGRFPDRHIDL